MPQAFGYFEGKADTRWSDDGRNMVLLNKFSYVDQTSKTWLAPANSVIDGASIPRVFWTVVGSPFTGKYRKASIVHDVYCENKIEPWLDTHKMFYFACRTAGTDAVLSKTLYWAVYHFGPRWTISRENIARDIPEADLDKLKAVGYYIKKNDPTLQELEGF